ncbi:MAG: CAL67264 family membrane protein [Flavobacteriaceae bacterium]
MFRTETDLMSLNKNKIFGYAALIMGLLGVALVLLGVFLYKEYIVGFSLVGAGFIAVAWTFNALRGRI